MSQVESKPIFVVGSPRSGTSILTWCLGQHSNILAQEESDWMGCFSRHVAIAYNTGTRRGERSQLSGLGVSGERFFAQFGDSINDLILGQRQEYHDRARSYALGLKGSTAPAEFTIARSPSDPKRRWVDGTPEYALHICGLRKLFPAARFLHIVREVEGVVASMLGFTSSGGDRLVQSEKEAYEYWLRRANACYKAEQAYGPGIVYRIRYTDLVDDPQASLTSVLKFLGESYESACAEPLRKRINSSPPHPGADDAQSGADEKLKEEARQLQRRLLKRVSIREPSSEAAAELEEDFDAQVLHVTKLSKYYRNELIRSAKLQKEIDELKSRAAGRPGILPKWIGGRKPVPHQTNP